MAVALRPTVSVLVTVYNRAGFLPACLDSVLASSWEDFEVVVVDDLSTDQSHAIAESYRDRDPRVRVFRNEKNLGDYPNRARAASLARGKYLKYVDSDDLIYRHGLATMVEAMEAHPDAALGLSHSLPEDERPYPWRLDPREAWHREFLGDGCMGCGPSGAIIRADAFDQAGGFGDWGVLSDTDLWYRMSARWPLVLMPPGLVWWRRHEGQEYVGGNASLTYLRDGFRLGIASLASPDNPLGTEETAAAAARVRRRLARRVLSLALKHRKPLAARTLARDSRLTVREFASAFGRKIT